MTENTPRSWKDIRSQRRGALFIGRREQLQTFQANFGGAVRGGAGFAA